MNRLLITRHAPSETDHYTDREVLTERGIDICRTKVWDLQTRKKIGNDAILLSSYVRNAVLTTSEIRQGLRLPRSYQSPFIAAAGLYPFPVQDLHGFTTKVLEACEVDHDGRDVVLVTHRALANAVDRGIGDDIAEVPKGWINPQFMPEAAYMAESPDHLNSWLR